MCAIVVFGLGNVSEMTYFVCQVGRKTLTQSLNVDCIASITVAIVSYTAQLIYYCSS